MDGERIILSEEKEKGGTHREPPYENRLLEREVCRIYSRRRYKNNWKKTEKQCVYCGRWFYQINVKEHRYCSRLCWSRDYCRLKKSPVRGPDELREKLRLGPKLAIENGVKYFSLKRLKCLKQAIDHKLSLPARAVSTKSVLKKALDLEGLTPDIVHINELKSMYWYIARELEKRGGKLSENRSWTTSRPEYKESDGTAIYDFPKLQDRMKTE